MNPLSLTLLVCEKRLELEADYCEYNNQLTVFQGWLKDNPEVIVGMPDEVTMLLARGQVETMERMRYIVKKLKALENMDI